MTINVRTDREIVDWLAKNYVITGTFVLDPNQTEDSEGTTVEHYAIQYNIPLEDAFRQVISQAIELNLELVEEELDNEV